MSNDPRTDFFASGGQTEPGTATPSTGDTDADAVLAEMSQSAATPFDPDAYLEQQIAAEVAALTSEQEQRQAEDNTKAEADAVTKAFQTRLAAAIKEIPDYQAVIDGSEAIARHHILNYLIESDVGPKLQYHLAKNPEVLDRLNQLSPIKAIAELGKLEVKLDQKAQEMAQCFAEVDKRMLMDWVPNADSRAKPI